MPGRCSLRLLAFGWRNFGRIELQIIGAALLVLAQIDPNIFAAGDFLAANYHDDWGHDRAALVNRLHLVLRLFTSLTIEAANPQVSANSPSGWWSAKVKIEGSGNNEFTAEVVSRVNVLTDPFVLHWQRRSWRPWDWKLVRVSNPSLELPSRDL